MRLRARNTPGLKSRIKPRRRHFRRNLEDLRTITGHVEDLRTCVRGGFSGHAEDLRTHVGSPDTWKICRHVEDLRTSGRSPDTWGISGHAEDLRTRGGSPDTWRISGHVEDLRTRGESPDTCRYEHDQTSKKRMTKNKKQKQRQPTIANKRKKKKEKKARADRVGCYFNQHKFQITRDLVRARTCSGGFKKTRIY